MPVRHGLSLATLALCISFEGPSAAAPPPAEKVIARIDLSKPFHLPPGARFTAAQGHPVEDPATEGTEPGAIHLCVRMALAKPCSPDLDSALTVDKPDLFSTIHYLDRVELVYPNGSSALPLLHLQYSSFHSTDGGQSRASEILAYRPGQQRFRIIFHELFGSNGNEEVRYIASGPLRGDVISAEPTDNAPFGYWITVNRLTPGYRYRQVLRYRSATHYGDGNRLAVIDSEMPNILRRLGLWRTGQPLPLPKSGCAKPRLVKSALWCS